MQNLLHQPKANLVKAISQVMGAIDEAAPIPAAHKRGLPHDIRDLSALLTEERGGMARPYWAAKNFFSAYIHYFLPWNLYRLSWLLPSLPLPLKGDSVILDLGSGPLTLPLALWCARPELRDVPLHFICTDIANQPMEQGLAIFNALTKNHSPWNIECVKATIETALSTLPAILPEKSLGLVDCIMAGNVLNELQPAKGQTLNDRITAIVHACARRLKPEGTMLFVEPGTRLGGKVIIMAREAGRMLGLPIVAPCPHQEHCPLAKTLEREETVHRPRPRGRQMASLSNMWCHFSFPVEGAPGRLARLTAAAKFDRRSLALSCLVMQAGEQTLSVKDAALLSDLDELEALYAETVLSDEGMDSGFGGKTAGYAVDMAFADTEGETVPRGSDVRAPKGKANEARGQGWKNSPLGRKSVEEQGRWCHAEERPHGDDVPEPPLWARIISGPIRLPKETLPARYGCSAAGLVLVRRCERIPYGAAVEVVWDRPRRDEKSGALLVDMIDSAEGSGLGWQEEDDRKTGDGGTGGRTRRAGGKALRAKAFHREGVRERNSGATTSQGKAGKRGKIRKSETRQRGLGQGSFERDEDKGQSGSSAVGRSVNGLRNYFSRPQKMRERYGGLPASLTEPKDAFEKGSGKGKGSFRRKNEDRKGEERFGQSAHSDQSATAFSPDTARSYDSAGSSSSADSRPPRAKVSRGHQPVGRYAARDNKKSPHPSAVKKPHGGQKSGRDSREGKTAGRDEQVNTRENGTRNDG